MNKSSNIHEESHGSNGINGIYIQWIVGAAAAAAKMLLLSMFE